MWLEWNVVNQCGPLAVHSKSSKNSFSKVKMELPIILNQRREKIWAHPWCSWWYWCCFLTKFMQLPLDGMLYHEFIRTGLWILVVTVVLVSMVKSECCMSNWKVRSEIVTKNGRRADQRIRGNFWRKLSGLASRCQSCGEWTFDSTCPWAVRWVHHILRNDTCSASSCIET